MVYCSCKFILVSFAITRGMMKVKGKKNLYQYIKNYMILWNFLLLLAIQPLARFLQAHFCVPASNTPNRFITGAGKPIYSSCRRSKRYLPLLSRALWRYIMDKYSEFFHILKVFFFCIWLVTAVGKIEDTSLRNRVTHTLLSTFLAKWHTHTYHTWAFIF